MISILNQHFVISIFWVYAVVGGGGGGKMTTIF